MDRRLSFGLGGVRVMRDVAGAEESPSHLKEAEAHAIRAQRDAEIDHPARPFELLRFLVRVELIHLYGAERADDAGKQGPAQQREKTDRLARRLAKAGDHHVDADMEPGAHPERGAELG